MKTRALETSKKRSSRGLGPLLLSAQSRYEPAEHTAGREISDSLKEIVCS